MIWTLSSADCRQQSCPQELSRLPRLRVKGWEMGRSFPSSSAKDLPAESAGVQGSRSISTSITHEDLSVPSSELSRLH